MRISVLVLSLAVCGSAAGQEKILPIFPAGPVPWAEMGTISGKKLTPDAPSSWSVTWTRLEGGKEQGVDLVHLAEECAGQALAK